MNNKKKKIWNFERDGHLFQLPKHKPYVIKGCMNS